MGNSPISINGTAEKQIKVYSDLYTNERNKGTYKRVKRYTRRWMSENSALITINQVHTLSHTQEIYAKVLYV